MPTSAMPDPMAKWTPVPDWATATISCVHWQALPILGLDIVMLAGDMGAALAAHAGGTAGLGLLAIAERGDNYVIRIARDRALMVAARPFNIAYGWQPAGYSVTSADSAYGIIEMSGSALDEIISEGTATDPALQSRSAATLFAGIPCLVIRTAPDVARLHMEIGHMAYVWRWLKTRV